MASLLRLIWAIIFRCFLYFSRLQASHANRWRISIFLDSSWFFSFWLAWRRCTSVSALKEIERLRPNAAPFCIYIFVTKFAHRSWISSFSSNYLVMIFHLPITNIRWSFSCFACILLCFYNKARDIMFHFPSTSIFSTFSLCSSRRSIYSFIFMFFKEWSFRSLPSTFASILIIFCHRLSMRKDYWFLFLLSSWLANCCHLYL